MDIETFTTKHLGNLQVSYGLNNDGLSWDDFCQSAYNQYLETHTIKVAVYGTLKQGGQLNGAMGGLDPVKFHRLPGFRMLNLGWYPGIVPAEGKSVFVEVYDITEEILSRLDGVEGAFPEAPESGLYRRETVKIDNDDVFIYIWNGKEEGYEEIENGFFEVN